MSDIWERFWAKVDVGGVCWEWMGARSPLGYGRFSGEGGKTVLVHRWAWENLVGPIPAGLVMDHLCRHPPCVNPDHLEPVTRLENTRRGYSWARPLREVCKAGLHDMATHAALNSKGDRLCSPCAKAWRRERDKTRTTVASRMSRAKRRELGLPA